MVKKERPVATIRMNQGRSMKCDRCGCMMIYEKFFYETEQFWGWKCVLCGECIDPLILENRRLEEEEEERPRIRFKKVYTHP